MQTLKTARTLVALGMVAMLIAPAVSAESGPLLQYGFFDGSANTLSPRFTAPRVHGCDFTTGAGVTFLGFGEGQPNPGHLDVNWSTGDILSALDAGSYVSFTITPDPGYQISLDSVAFQFRPDGSGPRQIRVLALPASSGFTGAEGSPYGITVISQEGTDSVRKPWDTVTLDLSQFILFQNSPVPVALYLVGFDSKQPGREMDVDNANLLGQVTPIPEPRAGVYAMLGLAVMIWRRRPTRRHP